MYTKNQFFKLTTGTLISSLFLLILVGSAFADECIVHSPNWSMTSGRGLTLPAAIYYAERNDGTTGSSAYYQECRNEIKVEIGATEVIRMTSPIVINIPDLKLTGSGATPFILDASDINWGDYSDFKCVITINSSGVELKNLKIRSNTNSPEGGKAICINAAGAKLDGVHIDTARGDGIAFNGYGGEIRGTSSLKNIEGGSYIDFGETSPGSTFTPSTLVPWVNTDGTDAAIPSNMDKYGLVLPTTDIARLLFEGGGNDGGVQRFIKNTGSPLEICLGKADANATLVYTDASGASQREPAVQIFGWVADRSSSDAQKRASTVERLQIYTKYGFYGYVGGAIPPAGSSVPQSFVGMGRKSITGDVYGSTTGYFKFYIPKNAKIKGADAGSQEESLRQITLVPETSGFAVGKMSAIIDLNGKIGPCSNVYPGNAAPITQFLDAAGATGSTTSPPPSPAPSGPVKRFLSQKDCCITRGIQDQCGDRSAVGSPIDPNYDTDGDGIYDMQEDTNGNCIWEKDIGETDWVNADSDNDGELDKIEMDQCDRSQIHLDANRQPNPVTTRGENIYKDACHGFNPLNRDSDGDGMSDGAEDRNQSLARTTTSASGTTVVKSVLYPIDRAAGVTPITRETTGETIVCSLAGQESKNIGVRYMFYKFYNSDTKAPDEYSFSTSNYTSTNAPSDFVVVPVVCKFMSLNSPFNFNAQYEPEQNLELDSSKPDTDEDGWCDGAGGTSCNTTAIANFHGVNDKCPLIKNIPETRNDCGGRMLCSQSMQLYTIDWKYVNWGTNGADTLRDSGPLKIKDANDTVIFEQPDDGSIANNNIPDILEVKDVAHSDDHVAAYKMIANLAADMDGDGIPSIVENPDAICYSECPTVPISGGETRFLDYCADSDGDSLVDGYAGGQSEDVCPLTGGTVDTANIVNSQDIFDEEKPHVNYSCEPRKSVYAVRQNDKIISCFLDRDSDGLRDCEEDVNGNGEYVPSRTPTGSYVTKDILDASESDPLKFDSDADELSDKYEKTSKYPKLVGTAVVDHYTNPGDADTDKDSLPDGVERRTSNGNPDAPFQLGDMPGMDLCRNAFTLQGTPLVDSDPTELDTDKDDLSDSEEIPLQNGEFHVGQEFVNMLVNPNAWRRGGIPMMSNPRSKDGDGDGVLDKSEYRGGIVRPNGSNPCMYDSDGDGRNDNSQDSTGWGDRQGCQLNPRPDCVPTSTSGNTAFVGPDQDSDGLPDSCEAMLGTDAYRKDSDGDGISDYDEDLNHDCVFNEGFETDPRPGTGFDTDKDGLSDGKEGMPGGAGSRVSTSNSVVSGDYITDPINADSDGDCIPDSGPTKITLENGDEIMSKGEDRNKNGKVDSNETAPMEDDTDGDGLSDGLYQGLGEDVNCDGVRNKNSSGGWLETDPLNGDSNFDGTMDRDAICSSGNCNMGNLSRALNTQGGCSLVTTSTNATTSEVVYVMLALSLLVGVRFMRSRKPLLENCEG